jgi:hypothetical protein
MAASRHNSRKATTGKVIMNASIATTMIEALNRLGESGWMIIDLSAFRGVEKVLGSSAPILNASGT